MVLLLFCLLGRGQGSVSNVGMFYLPNQWFIKLPKQRCCGCVLWCGGGLPYKLSFNLFGRLIAMKQELVEMASKKLLQ